MFKGKSDVCDEGVQEECDGRDASDAKTNDRCTSRLLFQYYAFLFQIC